MTNPNIEEGKIQFGEDGYVHLTQQQLDKLKKKFGARLVAVSVEILNNHIGVDPDKWNKAYKSHYHVIQKWVIDAAKKKIKEQGATNDLEWQTKSTMSSLDNFLRSGGRYVQN